jgi:hypothetical protein
MAMALVAMPQAEAGAPDCGLHAITVQGASLGRQEDAVHIVVNDEDVSSPFTRRRKFCHNET